MHRLLIAAATAAFVAVWAGAVAAPALADDYPPCTHARQDHCREVGRQSHDYPRHHHHHH